MLSTHITLSFLWKHLCAVFAYEQFIQSMPCFEEEKNMEFDASILFLLIWCFLVNCSECFFFHAYFIRLFHHKIAYIILSWWYDCWKCNCLVWIHLPSEAPFGSILHRIAAPSHTNVRIDNIATLPPLVRTFGVHRRHIKVCYDYWYVQFGFSLLKC